MPLTHDRLLRSALTSLARALGVLGVDASGAIAERVRLVDRLDDTVARAQVVQRLCTALDVVQLALAALVPKPGQDIQGDRDHAERHLVTVSVAVLEARDRMRFLTQN